MSQITKYGKRVNNVSLFCSVAEELGHEVISTNEVAMYGSQRVEAVAQVNLRDWKLPIAVDKEGTIYFDQWGTPASSMKHLGAVMQEYNVKQTEQIIPVDEVESYWFEEMENGDKKLVMEYE